MAEAHQGVAFSFAVTEDEGLHLNVSYEAIYAVLLSGTRNWRKKIARFINSVLNGVYPSHPTRGLVLISVVTCLKRYQNYDVSFGFIDFLGNKIPRSWMTRDTADITSCIVAGAGLWLISIATRRYSLQLLFSYHGWMYEVHGKFSLKSKLWSVIVKILVGHKPHLLSNQSSMPYMPLPKLEDTMKRYLRTVRPLLDNEAYNRIEREAKDFQKTLGKRLQRYLILKSWVSSNYVSDWWEEYVYLRGRSPIMVNSNFYGLDILKLHPTQIQAARAGNITHCAFMYRRELDNETLNPIIVQDMVPLCSRQYERQFNTTRVPGEVTDKIQHMPDSKHIAVYSSGKWFKLFTYYQSQLLNCKELETQFQKILDDKTLADNGEKHLAALTAGDRVPWAQARKQHFSTGINKSSLNAIEKAAFVLILDEDEYNTTSNDERQLDTYARALLHGKGYDRWFDKSFNIIVGKNAKVGFNAEHSWADAPITGHLWEYTLADDIVKIGYETNGHTKGALRYNLPEPLKLKWNMNQECLDSIMASMQVATKLLNDVDLHIYAHTEFGKGLAKKYRFSPDAFIQMSLQLAYYRDIGCHHLTYESAMTRLFREGRTETVRSCSVESATWVNSMVNGTSTIDEKYKLFKAACEYHQQQYRDAMSGKGIDRHLFCLYVISKYLDVDSPFLKEVLSEPWRLSTSQTPSSQTAKIDFTKNPEFISAGGGFGPVADDGYGISYIVTGENNLFFHISSKRSSNKTDSLRMGGQICKALCDVRDMLASVQMPVKKAVEANYN